MFFNILWVWGLTAKALLHAPVNIFEIKWICKLMTLNSKGFDKKKLKQKIDKLYLRATVRF